MSTKKDHKIGEGSQGGPMWSLKDIVNKSNPTGKKLVGFQANKNSSTSNNLMGVEEEVGRKRSKKESAEKKEKAVADGGRGESEHEHGTHILTERERRKKMRTMFSNLHALLPQLSAKVDKSTIVDEAVKHIKTLEQTLQTLEKQKLEKHLGVKAIDYEPSIITPLTPALDQSREAFLSAQGPSRDSPTTPNMHQAPSFPASLSPACFHTWFSPNVVLNMCGDNAQISVCSLKKQGLFTTLCYILEKHNLEVVSANVSSDQCRSIYMIHARATAGTSDSGVLSMEDTFKLAAGEMNLWLLSC